MTSSRRGLGTSRRAGLSRLQRAFGLLGSVFVLAFLGSCEVGPSGPSQSTTTSTTTTTTTTSTTTTTTGGTSTTSTTTTTTLGLVSYANEVHPIWDKEGCTNCHDSSGNPLDLTGSPDESCAKIAARDSSNQNLIVLTPGAEATSALIEKPQGKVSHAGGSYSCFGGAGDSCYDTVLLWLQQGANGPTAACGG